MQIIDICMVNLIIIPLRSIREQLGTYAKILVDVVQYLTVFNGSPFKFSHQLVFHGINSILMEYTVEYKNP